ncbi:hypothetical protein FB474_0109 [Oryzihumus leptocrescens]|uniref:Uncharacterized protein n=2 Tax=Oryzihumus leptocrescens TaxID=297536 RepID=A0A542ZEK0_9MICO|nr:hypothetical protein FB474_0109 [Oryzihumus leptocrescens]
MASTPPRPTRSTLHDDLLPPTVGIDPGSVATGIVLRVGTRLIAVDVVLNPEPGQLVGGGVPQRPCSPEWGYGEAVEARVRALATEHDASARAWWAKRGYVLAADEDPWLYGIEKVNLPRDPRGQETFRKPDAETVASVVAPTAVLHHLRGALGSERVVLVRPFRADTRWEKRYGGTGDPRDYYPGSIIEPAAPASDPVGTVYRDGLLDQRRFREARVKDQAAAWSIASDAAGAYVEAARRLGRPVVPPSQGADVLREGLRAMQRSLGAPVSERLAPVIPMPQPAWVTTEPEATRAPTGEDADGTWEDLSTDEDLDAHYAHYRALKAWSSPPSPPTETAAPTPLDVWPWSA